VSIYRLHDTTGDDLGLLEHPAPNVEPSDVVVLADGREAIVTARVEAEPGPLVALLEVAIARTPVAGEESIVTTEYLAPHHSRQNTTGVRLAHVLATRRKQDAA
jgi:hypothetical protein